MENANHETFIGKLSTQVAIASFVIGTVLLILGITFRENEPIVLIGYLFVILAFFLNVFMLGCLVICWAMNWRNYKYYIVKTLILVANIPIAFLYLLTLLHYYEV